MLEAVNVSAEIVAAILGISVTVVAIVVQLAAGRYNHQITRMFIREPVNVAVQGYFVLTTLVCIWIAATGDDPALAQINVVALVMVSVALLGLLPYFGYVFTFISPLSIIRRIRRGAEAAIRAGKRIPASRAIDQLQDVARSAVDQGDRAIAMACVTALADLFQYYRSRYSSLPAQWFDVREAMRDDPDFVALEPSAIEELNASRLWVEVKIFQQFLSIMRMCISRMQDVAGGVGIAVRQIAFAHLDDDNVLQATWRCFNSSLRASINARDARTSYHLLSQYKTVAEALLRKPGREPAALAAAEHIQSYGQLAYNMDQPFILEVAAFDLGELIRAAKEEDSSAIDALLDAFLELDHEIKSELQEQSLLGVRRAQMQVGAYLLAEGDTSRAQQVADDLASERPERLHGLRDAMMSEEKHLFWEFTPRGVNFGYLAPQYRVHLDRLLDMADMNGHTSNG